MGPRPRSAAAKHADTEQGTSSASAVTVRSFLAEVADRCSIDTARPRACVHTDGTKYLCDRHPSLGPLCGSCATAHSVRRHLDAGDRCPSCERDGQHLVTVLLAVGDGMYVEGLAFCVRCLLAATAHGRRLAS